MTDSFLDAMEEDSSEEKVLEDLSQKDLESVAVLAQNQVELEQDLAGAEEIVKKIKKDLYVLSSETIPEKMKALGLTAFEMDTGESLKVIKKVTASISEKNKTAAHKWLVKKGHGDIIKHTVTTKFSMGEESKAKALVKQLNTKGLNYDVKQAVHSQTLKAFVNEQLEKGNDIDTELLGVFEYNVTKIETPKKKR